MDVILEVQTLATDGNIEHCYVDIAYESKFLEDSFKVGPMDSVKHLLYLQRKEQGRHFVKFGSLFEIYKPPCAIRCLPSWDKANLVSVY